LASICASGGFSLGRGELAASNGVCTTLGMGTSDFCGLDHLSGIAWASPCAICWGTGTGTGCKGADRGFPNGNPAGLGGGALWSETGCSTSTVYGSPSKHAAPSDRLRKWDDDTCRTRLLQITLYDTLETALSFTPGSQFSRRWVTDRTHTRSPTWKTVTIARSAAILFSLTSCIFHLRRLLGWSTDKRVLGRRPRKSSAGNTPVLV